MGLKFRGWKPKFGREFQHIHVTCRPFTFKNETKWDNAHTCEYLPKLLHSVKPSRNGFDLEYINLNYTTKRCKIQNHIF